VLVSSRNTMVSGTMYTCMVVTNEKLYLMTCDDQRGTLGSNATLYQVLSLVFRLCQVCDGT